MVTERTVIAVAEHPPHDMPDSTDVDREAFLLDIATGEQHELTEHDPMTGDALPSWAPDGTRMVFAGSDGDDEAARLCVIAPDGSDDTELVVAVDTIRPPAWSAAGDMLAFQRDLRDLHVTDLAGNVRTVATDVRDPIAWSKTGSRLAFVRASPERSDVVIIDLDRGDETTVTDADDFAWQP